MFTKKNPPEEKDNPSIKNDPRKTEKSSGCCMGTSTCSSGAASQSHSLAQRPSSFPTTTEGKKGGKTRVVVKYDVGFNNSLYLRGKGANLSWDKGVALKNTKNDEWVWETDAQFTTCEFKVLINDKQYENGTNHHLIQGASMQYTPSF